LPGAIEQTIAERALHSGDRLGHRRLGYGQLRRRLAMLPVSATAISVSRSRRRRRRRMRASIDSPPMKNGYEVIRF
jgi:hypothetical protein